jgi:hypothetical protein
MANENNRTKIRALAAVFGLALFGLPACGGQGLDEDVGVQSQVAPTPSSEQGLDVVVDTPVPGESAQQCVGGGWCGDGYHCCGDGTRDWCCPQSSACTVDGCR